MPRTAKNLNNKAQDKTEHINDSSLLDLSNANIKKLLKKGKEKKILSWDEINKAIPEGSLSSDQIEDLHASFDQLGITIVDKDEENEDISEKEGEEDVAVTGNLNDETGRTDDPVRMYLKEMGGVELLSREGEIAIAKRIEAGKDVMLIALSQSPITAQQFFEWDEKLQKDEILVREIIDIDTNYMEDENTGPSAKQKNSGEVEKEENSNDESDDDFNPTLAAMESEIKPKVLKTVNLLTKEYRKLIKYQKEKLDCILNTQTFSSSKEKGHTKIVNDILL